MAQSIILLAGVLPSMDELRNAAQTLHQFCYRAPTKNRTALDYTAYKLIQSADRIDNGLDRRVAV